MNIETMRLLVAKGLSADDILEVAESLRTTTDRSAGAERQARYRARKAESNVTSDVTRDGNSVTDSTPFPAPPNENNLTPPTHTPVYISRARKDSDFPMLDCADAGLWADFLKNRKAKNLPCTATAHKKLRTDLARWSQEIGWPPGEVLTACVGKGWGAIYDPRDKENGNNGRNSNNSSRNGKAIDGFTAALRHVANGPTDEPFGNDGRGMHRTA